MKATILDGSLGDNGVLQDIHEFFRNALERKNWSIESFLLRHMRISHCFGCWFETPGSCFIKDDGREVAKKFIDYRDDR